MLVRMNHLRSRGATARGFGLLELLLVLAVFAVITMTAFRYYIVTQEARRVTNAIQYIERLVQASSKWIVAGKAESDLSVAQMVKQGYLPPADEGAQSYLWSSTATVRLSGQVLTILLTPIPNDACQNLRARLQGIAQLKVDTATCSGNLFIMTIPVY